jgi:hypothetical protein
MGRDEFYCALSQLLYTLAVFVEYVTLNQISNNLARKRASVVYLFKL